MSNSIRCAILVGEVSGDALGAKLIPELRIQFGDRPVEFIGTAGPVMGLEGVQSFFPLDDIAVMGIVPVIKRLPSLLRRIGEAADRIIAAKPDILIIIDSPDFTHRVAKRVKSAFPDLPVINYVSPSVWAWRSGRAKKMSAYIDHVLALLPFEVDAHKRLGGPTCTYVGHPLIERLDILRPNESEIAVRETDKQILILPGSRRSEISRLLPVFRDVAVALHAYDQNLKFILPAVDHLYSEIVSALADWPIKPVVVRGETHKYQAFRKARVALAASGTVTLELALAQVPMVVGYRVSIVESALRFLVNVSSIVLPNLIVGHRSVPEFIQENCTSEKLAAALIAIIPDGAARNSQLSAFQDLDHLMRLEAETPSQRAARVIVQTVEAKNPK